MYEHLKETIRIHKNIIFGPFIGELDFELYHWSPYIKHLATTTDKNIKVITRYNRMDIYNNCMSSDNIETFKLDGDYDYVKPLFDRTTPHDTDQNIINVYLDKIHKDNPRHIIITPSSFDNRLYLNKLGFNPEYNIKPRRENRKYMNTLMAKKTGNLIPITIIPRHRHDIDKKNWGKNRWVELFNLLTRSKKFFIFVAGCSPTVTEYNYGYHNRTELLEKYNDPTKKISTFGLTYEAMRSSRLVIGPQTALIKVANQLEIPVLTWGNHEQKYTKEFAFNNKNITFLNTVYGDPSPKDIFDKLKNILQL